MSSVITPNKPYKIVLTVKSLISTIEAGIGTKGRNMKYNTSSGCVMTTKLTTAIIAPDYE